MKKPHTYTHVHVRIHIVSNHDTGVVVIFASKLIHHIYSSSECMSFRENVTSPWEYFSCVCTEKLKIIIILCVYMSYVYENK